MRRVILESPYRGDNYQNEVELVHYALDCLYESLKRGDAPMVSHLLYTQVLDDHIPEERSLGLEAGFMWIPAAQASVVYIDHGISLGMHEGIKFAHECKIPVEYYKLGSGRVSL